MHKFNLLKSRTAAVVTGAVVVVGLGATGATAANLIDSGDIRNGSIRGVDIANHSIDRSEVRNGSLTFADLGQGIQNRLQLNNEEPEVRELERTNGQLQERIAQLETAVAELQTAEEQNGTANTNWVPGNGSVIVDENTVTLTKTATDSSDATSVEIANLDIPVQAGDVIAFDVSFADGAVCVGGAPRVFVETQGAFHNSFDQALPCANGTAPGADNDQAGTVEFTVPNNGRIGQAGVVYDDGSAGTVTVTNLTIDGNLVSFQ